MKTAYDIMEIKREKALRLIPAGTTTSLWAVTGILSLLVLVTSLNGMHGFGGGVPVGPKVYKGQISHCYQIIDIPEAEKPDALELWSPPGIKPAPVTRADLRRFMRVYLTQKEQQYQTTIQAASTRFQVDSDLVRAIIMAESAYNRRAVSNKGARGLMQLMPRTAEALGVKDSFNPEHNINGGVKYIKRLLERFEGDLNLALAAYHAGSHKVRRYGGVPPYRSTQIYIKRVISYYRLYKQAKRV